jgi:DinB superfamily
MTPTTGLKAQFDLNTRLFNNVFADVADNEANKRFSEGSNNMLWIGGHTLNSRINPLAKTMGLIANDAYAAQFARGTVVDGSQNYPSISAILYTWNESAAVISSQFDLLSQETLETPTPFNSPIGDNTVLGVISFFLLHEAHHIGQLSVLRKLLGKDSMSFR